MLNAFDSINNHNMVYCGRGAASQNANGFQALACRQIDLFEINIYNFTFITVLLGHKCVLINNEAILHSGQDSLQPKIHVELG